MLKGRDSGHNIFRSLQFAKLNLITHPNSIPMVVNILEIFTRGFFIVRAIDIAKKKEDNSIFFGLIYFVE